MGAMDELLRAIVDDPGADEPRAVYADRLIEAGDPHGELIRLQLQLARLRPGDDGFGALLAAQDRLVAAHPERWLAPRARRVAWLRRGFYWRATIDEVALADAELARHPIVAIDVFDARAPDALLGSPLLLRARTIDFFYEDVDPEALPALFAHAPRLTSFHFSTDEPLAVLPLVPPSVAALGLNVSGDVAAVCAHLSGRRRLSLRVLRPDEAGLAACARLADLAELAIVRPPAALPSFPPLESLRLVHCDRLPPLPPVRRLEIDSSFDGDGVVRALAADPALAAVEELILALWLSPDSVAALARSPFAGRLRRLELRGFRLEDAEVLAPLVPQLTTLTVGALGAALDLERVLGPRLAMLTFIEADEPVARRLADGHFPALGRVSTVSSQPGAAIIAERWPQVWAPLGDPDRGG
ncbi:TIGR02996 domain-containing protein [Sandaracinus amylolyticus]|uniref:TIGR02996 domain-containing protein n=1 Tax=Sandaracinus amylolyticus TaxID=927083 RepID=UPI001F3A309F|nr:TIGR02996 domain-containing protein [Sandaracinus amylolyticus]